MTKTKARKSRIVNLDDNNGSVSGNLLICRDVLWGIVEYIKENDKLRQVDETEAEIDESFQDVSSELPLSFGSTKGKHSNKRKKIDTKKARKRVKPTTETLKTPEYNGKLVEHNVYFRNIIDNGNLTKEIVKVIGVGKDGSGSVALRRLCNDTILHIPRTTTHLSSVPVSHYNQDLYDQCENDIWWRLRRNKPDHIHEKYWDQRYRIFSKFDDGIRLDEESWYSITYETIGKYIVDKYRKLEENNQLEIHTVLDCFSGCGGMTIPFASAGKYVYAVDWDSSKLAYLR
jgi:hypothetical protein